MTKKPNRGSDARAERDRVARAGRGDRDAQSELVEQHVLGLHGLACALLALSATAKTSFKSPS